jgi:hypothetical protein
MFNQRGKSKESKMEDKKKEKSCIDPIVKYLRIFKKIGGFPLTIKQSNIIFSKWEFVIFAIHVFFAFIAVNTFTCFGFILPKRNLFIYLEIFKTVGFSSMDFSIGFVVVVTNLTSSILNFVCLRKASSRFDGICDDLSKVIFRKNNFTKQYNGKGKVMF